MSESTFLIVNVEELEFLVDRWVLGNTEEDLRVLSAGEFTEIGKSKLAGCNLLLKLVTGDFSGRRSDSLENPVDNIVFSSTTSVFGLNSFAIKMELKICGIINIFT